MIPTPVDLDRFRDAAAGDLCTRLGLEDREVLLYVGRIAREKGLDLLLNTFAEVHARRPQTRLLLVGSGPYLEGAEALRGQLSLGEAVTFVGPVPYAEIAPYYAAADLFVFSSTTETQGLVLLEALAAGTPVVAVSAPGAADIIKNGGGRLTEASQASFAQGILRVLEDEVERSKLRQEAPAVAEHYSIACNDQADDRSLRAGLDMERVCSRGNLPTHQLDRAGQSGLASPYSTPRRQDLLESSEKRLDLDRLDLCRLQGIKDEASPDG